MILYRVEKTLSLEFSNSILISISFNSKRETTNIEILLNENYIYIFLIIVCIYMNLL